MEMGRNVRMFLLMLLLLLLLFSPLVYSINSVNNDCMINKTGIQVKANCVAMGIHFIPNDLPPTITYLDLSENKIPILRNSSFVNYKNLVSITIDKNPLSSIDGNAFIGLDRLQLLSMQNNKLDLATSYHQDVFRPLYALKKLDIRSNTVYQYATRAINYPYFGELRSLVLLYMDLVPIPSFNISGMQSLTKLKILGFENCYLISMLNTTFHGLPQCVEEIYFKNCKSYISVVELNFLNPFPNLQVLNINTMNVDISNALQILYPFTHKHMKAIIFIRVVIVYQQAVILTKDMMLYLHNICVNTLILSENEIVDFEQDSLLAHTYPECFNNMALSGNRFSVTGKNIGDFVRFSVQLVNLTTFDISYNLLKYSDIKYLCMPYIDMFYQDQYITHPMALRRRGSGHGCFHIKDRHYNFEELDYGLNTIERQFRDNPGPEVTIIFPQSLQTLRMSHFLGNSFVGRKLIIKNSSSLHYVDFSYFRLNYFPDIDFDGPMNIKFLDISGIDSTLYSNKSYIPLFSGINTIIWKNAQLDRTMKTNGKNIFKLIPNVEKMDISGNSILNFDVNAFSVNTKLSNLIISNNLLTEIPVAVVHLSTLKKLDVSSNRLQSINETIRNWIDAQNNKSGHKFQLSIFGNIFKCTCETMDFIQWMFTTKIGFDKKNYKCKLSNGTEIDMVQVYNRFHEHFSNCNSVFWLRVGIGCLIAFVVFTTPLAIIVNFRWRLTFWVYRKFKRIIQHGMERKFKYDIYLSYTEDNILWIRDVLVPKIENSWKLNMCLEDRDFIGGDIKADAIANAIQESRHVMFVISEFFQENNWRAFEIERSKFEKYTNDLQKIIVIVKDVSVRSISIELDKILKDITILEWSNDNELLWDKLRMVIFSDLY
jgi:Leucine-rich repeat (LRR) protein